MWHDWHIIYMYSYLSYDTVYSGFHHVLKSEMTTGFFNVCKSHGPLTGLEPVALHLCGEVYKGCKKVTERPPIKTSNNQSFAHAQKTDHG